MLLLGSFWEIKLLIFNNYSIRRGSEMQVLAESLLGKKCEPPSTQARNCLRGCKVQTESACGSQDLAQQGTAWS